MDHARTSTQVPPTPTLTPTATEVSAPKPSQDMVVPTTTKDSSAYGLVANVIEVTDGDTMKLIFPDNCRRTHVPGYSAIFKPGRVEFCKTETVRLLGVDTPETFIPNKPNEYGSITNMGCLDRWGDLHQLCCVQK